MAAMLARTPLPTCQPWPAACSLGPLPHALPTSPPPSRLQVTNTSETVGTFAIAYAAHKALSPVRFPPTVALTPIVARWLGKEPPAAEAAAEQQQQPGGGE